jgi:hypothetical protein
MTVCRPVPTPAGDRRGIASRSALLLLAGSGLLAVAVGLLLVDRPQGPTAEVVELACAAGLRAPVERAVAAYREETAGRVLLQYGGSNTLVSQIVIARTGDLVLLADDAYLATLADAGLLAETLPVAEQQAVRDRGGFLPTVPEVVNAVKLGPPTPPSPGGRTSPPRRRSRSCPVPNSTAPGRGS